MYDVMEMCYTSESIFFYRFNKHPLNNIIIVVKYRKFVVPVASTERTKNAKIFYVRKPPARQGMSG